MHAPSILFGITQQAGGLSPWVWIFIVLVIIVLLLWWLGRQEPDAGIDARPNAESHPTPEAAVVEAPAPEISLVERTVLDVQPEVGFSEAQLPEAPDLVTRAGEEIVISEEAVKEITGDTTEIKPVEYAPVDAPPITPADVPEGGSLEDLHQPPAGFRLDDLELIEGIGPKIAAVLRDAGINTFPELAAADPAALRNVLRSAGLRIADPTTWPDQARLAAEGKWEEFKTLTESLRGGRRVA